VLVFIHKDCAIKTSTPISPVIFVSEDNTLLNPHPLFLSVLIPVVHILCAQTALKEFWGNCNLSRMIAFVYWLKMGSISMTRLYKVTVGTGTIYYVIQNNYGWWICGTEKRVWQRYSRMKTAPDNTGIYGLPTPSQDFISLLKPCTPLEMLVIMGVSTRQSDQMGLPSAGIKI